MQYLNIWLLCCQAVSKTWIPLETFQRVVNHEKVLCSSDDDDEEEDDDGGGELWSLILNLGT